MRLNGLYVVADLAIRTLDHPLVSRHRAPIILGSMREDVWYVPLVRTVVEHLSFSHFYQPGKPGGLVPYLWPGPRRKADKFYDRAVEDFSRGDRVAAFVSLGRVVHLLTDMCCPVHAHRSIHETDPFEWWVEGNKAKLLQLAVPPVDDAPRASELIERMALFTQDYATDDTNHAIGRLMKAFGRWKSVSAKEAGMQARALIPVAAAHTVALFRLFLRDVGVGLSASALEATAAV